MSTPVATADGLWTVSCRCEPARIRTAEDHLSLRATRGGCGQQYPSAGGDSRPPDDVQAETAGTGSARTPSVHGGVREARAVV